MRHATSSLCWLALLAVIGGCAPAYHGYSGCYVDCRYCAPPPLPYVHYEGCVCHSCAASNYLALQPQPAEEDVGTETDERNE